MVPLLSPLTMGKIAANFVSELDDDLISSPQDEMLFLSFHII